MIFLDTNICIYALKGIYPSIARNMRQHSSDSIFIPSIVKAELLYGARKSRNPEETLEKVSDFIFPFEIVPFDDEATTVYADIRTELEKAGQPIGPNDLIIAATVLSRHGTLITHNAGEFGRIGALDLDDWCEQEGDR